MKFSNELNLRNIVGNLLIMTSFSKTVTYGEEIEALKGKTLKYNKGFTWVYYLTDIGTIDGSRDCLERIKYTTIEQAKLGHELMVAKYKYELSDPKRS